MTIKNSHFSPSLFILSMIVLLGMNISISEARPDISETDKASLQQITHELNASNDLLQEAQRNADKQDRFRFSYRCLLTDISLIKRGLLTAINGIQNQAFQNQELCLEYGFSGRFGNESRFLQQYMQELQSILALVHESSFNTDRTLRTKFNYQILSSDIEAVIQGVERALVGSGEQRRTFPVLRGKYSQ